MRTNGRNLIRVLLSWLILAAVATVLPVHAQQKDYSKGFKKFYDLGLPDVSKATYVKLDMRNGGGIPDLSELLGDGKVRLSGNAWLLEEKAGKGRFVVANCKIMEVYDQKMLDQEQKEKMKVAPQGDRDVRSAWQVEMSALQQKPGGMWKNADLKGDVEKIMKVIGEVVADSSEQDAEGVRAKIEKMLDVMGY